MVIAPISLRKDYWQYFEVTDQDLDFLYSYLLEVEKPQTSAELLNALVAERIRQEKDDMQKQQQAGGTIYYPKEHYQVGQTIQFPLLDWQTGKVVSTRPGNNPELAPFEVIDVELKNGDKRQFAAGYGNHPLNEPVTFNADDPLLDINYVLEKYGKDLDRLLAEALESSPGLVRIAWMWFPRALLVDINAGHLNLAEAVLDMMGGGPLPTPALMEQIDLPQDVDANLNEFSLNLALQEDKRFDEVGAAGEVIWFLNRLEPEPVREIPLFLRYPTTPRDYSSETTRMLNEFGAQVIDELEPVLNPPTNQPKEEVTLSLIYSHWRAGTLPLAGNLVNLFPTAYESPRIQFTFVDGTSGEKISGWVVRANHYIYGLRDWYLSQGLIAGSLVHIRQGKNPGEVIIRADKKRPTREWVRTAIIGSDGGIVFSMLKHNIATAVDERMAIVTSDVEALDKVWEQNNKQRQPLQQTVRQTMSEMAKLSPQSHVHAEELYAGVNILRRCPPGPILNLLLESSWAKHLGNLYFRLDDSAGGDND
jgi:hypothetical protein